MGINERSCHPTQVGFTFSSEFLKMRLRELRVMDGKIEREFISILMESPLYFELRLRERRSLLSRLIKMKQRKSQEVHKWKNT
jgi:hypothetical protein